MRDVLASVGRLCALARVGSVTIRTAALENERDDSVGEACRLLQEAMQSHGIEAMDVATTITETEFLKLAGILSGTPSMVAGAIVETAEALSIWNVRLHAYGAKLRPTPRGMTAVAHPAAPAEQDAPSSPFGESAAPEVPTTTSYGTDDELAMAVERGDGRTVSQLLKGITDPRQFARAATSVALQLTVEQLLDGGLSYDEGHALLVRAGLEGARAVFDQLVAATETSDRRFLYDLAATLPCIGEVGREHVADSRWYVVRNAAGLIGESRAAEGITELSKLLRHPDQRVRVAAVVALGQIGGATAMARLESVLFDSSIEVRNRALALVFASPDSDPLPNRVLMALEEENALEYRLEMVAALAHVHTPRARARLEAFARRQGGTLDDHQVRLAALTALAAGHREHAIPLLRELTEDQNPYVRDRAVALLAA
jgi:HEAT repeat protein